jgi:hypothetical protein
MPDLMHRHHDLFIVIIRMRIIKQPEMDHSLLVKVNIITMNRAGKGSSIYLRIYIEKFQIRDRDVLIAADNKLFDTLSFVIEIVLTFYTKFLPIVQENSRFRG